jgi:hypothetical protein
MSIKRALPVALNVIGVLLLILGFKGTSLAQQPANNVLGHYDGIVGIAASYNIDDGYRVVLVATRNGDVREIFYKATRSTMPVSKGESVIAHFDGIVGIAGFYNEDDKTRVAIVATKDGNVWEVFYSQKGKGQSIIAHFDGIVGVAGFYARDDNYRIVLVATQRDLHEVFYHPQKGRGESIIGHYDNDIVAIAGYFARSTNYRGAGVATMEGYLYYLFYHPQKQLRTGFNREGDLISLAYNVNSVFVATKDGRLRSLPPGGQRVDLANIGGIEHVAVDYWDSENLIYSTSDGNLHKFLF